MPTIDDYQKSNNIAEMLSKKQKDEISSKVLTGFNLDDTSRSEWNNTMKKVLKISKQVLEHKSHPFPKASNVKYPLITKAAIDFAARTYPEIIQGGRIVKAKVIGDDPGFQKLERSIRVATHMSHQLLDQDTEWEDGLDRLLHLLPIFGTIFKKVYYSPIKDKNISELVIPDRLVVNQHIDSLESARRITHILEMHSNDIIERVREGIYSDIDVQDLSGPPEEDEFIDEGKGDLLQDEDAPITILEQHMYFDLDGDGYQEPYIVTLHKDSGEILRIVHRYKKVIRSKGKVKRIVPEQYFVDYHYIKSSDGSFYSVGIGSLLLPVNESINTLINQLIDSGTLANQQSGLIGRGMRMRSGSITPKMGEYLVVDTATGTDMRSNVMTFPTKEPSPALFQLLGLLIDVGKDLSSVTDILSGQQPAQNVPATTVLTLEKQGLKVFNAITKRLYRSLKKEFVRLYELNSKFLSDAEYQETLDDPLASVKLDYGTGKELEILPVADPAMASDAQRLQRAQAILELPTVDPILATRNFLEALQLEDDQIDALIPVPDPNAPPPPEDQKTLAETEKLHAETQQILAELQMAVQKLGLDQQQILSQTQESEARIAKMFSDGDVNIRKMEIVANKSTVETELKARDQLTKEESLVLEREKAMADVVIEVAKLADEDNSDDR